VEITVKDDERGDPPISEEALIQLDILTKEEYAKLVTLTKEISLFVQADLQDHALELYDIKLEFGRDKASGEIMLIDEISGGNMRVYNQENESISPLDLGEIYANK